MPSTDALQRRPQPVTKLEVAVWGVAILACSQVGYVGHPRYGPFIAAADVLCVLVAVPWAYLAKHRHRLRDIPWPPRALLAWATVGLLSVATSLVDAEGALSLANARAGAIEVAQLLLYFGLAYSLIADVASGVTKAHRLTLVLLVAVTAVVAWGLVDYIRQPDVARVAASFGNRNVYSAFLVVVLPLLYGQALHEHSRPMRAWRLAVCFVGGLTMLAPPHVWLLVGILCWMSYVRGGRARRILLPAIVAIAAVSTLVPRNHECNVTQLLDVQERGQLYKLEIPGASDEAPSPPGDEPPPGAIVKKRWLEWQPALAMLADNLALGTGAGTYQRNIGEAQYYGTLPNVRKSEPDTANLYLVVGASMGLAGLISLIAFQLHFWAKATRLWLAAGSPVERGLAAGLQGALVGIALANVFTSLFVRGVSLVWASVLAMTAVVARATTAPQH
jgi:hypothetical protein